MRYSRSIIIKTVSCNCCSVTANHIHLIDRNGNYVEKYPVKLRSPATNGLAVFDYDKNRDYRMFIAGSDRKDICLYC